MQALCPTMASTCRPCVPLWRQHAGPLSHRDVNMQALCPPGRFLNNVVNRHEIWHERDAIGGHPSAMYLICRRQ